MHPRVTLAFTILALASAASRSDAQTLGTFRWQLQPYCNIVTVTVTQSGGVYRLEGTDSRCGGGQDQASVIGTAFPNPDGSIGFGLNIVSTPDGQPMPVNADVSLATLNGTWRDSGGHSGAFVFTPGAGTGGSPRPAPEASTIPSSFGLFTDGQFVAKGALTVGNIPASGPGVRMMWHPAKAAFRAGEVSGAVPTVWNDVNVGVNSTAFGFDTLAAGAYSTAFGAGAAAVGPVSVAMGQNTQALSAYSTAMGNSTIASGISSTAMGSGTKAQAQSSTAMGAATIASGLYATVAGVSSVAGGMASFAVGNFVEATGTTAVAAGNNLVASGDRTVLLGSNARSLVGGSFMFGDGSAAATMFAPAANTFLARAAGGFWFYAASDYTKSCTINTNATFQCTGGVVTSSDRHRKRDLEPLDGEDVLRQLAGMPVTTWSFIDSPGVRHAGPMAQDFRAAFGLGENDTTIGYTDINGINMRAIQALESRTRDLQGANQMLADGNRSLRRENDGLRARLERLEQRLDKK